MNMTEGKKNDRIDGKVRMDLLPWPELEEWRPIKDFPKYEISDKGRIRSNNFYRRGYSIIMKTQLDIGGYECVKIRKGGRTVTLRIHRLVAEAFIPNPENKPFVDHINTIRNDNRKENLRWCTDIDNKRNPISAYNRRTSVKLLAAVRNAAKIGGVKRSKPVLQYSKDGTFISEYKSARDAFMQTGISFQKIGAVCLGKRKTSGGFIWKFKTKEI